MLAKPQSINNVNYNVVQDILNPLQKPYIEGDSERNQPNENYKKLFQPIILSYSKFIPCGH